MKSIENKQIRLKYKLVPYCSVVLFLVFSTIQLAAQSQDSKLSIKDELYMTYKELGMKKTIDFFKTLDGKIRNPSFLNSLGYTLINDGKLNDAIECFGSNLKIYPDYANGYDSQAEAFLYINKVEDALKSYRKLLTIIEKDRYSSERTLNNLKVKAKEFIDDYEQINNPKERILSLRIRALINEIKKDRGSALEKFKSEMILNKGPLVEILPDGKTLVTFVFFANKPLENVVIESSLEARQIENRKMIWFDNTNVWYKSFTVPAGLRLAYLFSPDDRNLSKYSSLYPSFIIESGLITDPLNPVKEYGEQDRYWSIFDLSDNGSPTWLSSDLTLPEEQFQKFSISSEFLKINIDIAVYTHRVFRIPKNKIVINY